MSLFKVRQFWCTNAEESESFDQNSMIVTSINSECDYIITGSHSGILRVFNPNCELSESSELSGFGPNDLVVEKIFDSPILQVGSGKLISGSGENQIAVLCPKLLSVYALVIKLGKTEHGNESFLQLLYEHKLRKSAYNFVMGPFGGIQNRDFICVQSLDGLLMFFEQESSGFYVALPDFLLPGPLNYVQKSDGFVTINSSWELVSIGYKALSDSAIEPDPIYSKPKVTFDWSYQLGEPVIDIAVVNSMGNDNENWIAVLGERNFFCLDEKGQLKFMKRFEFCPICFKVYFLGEDLVTLVVSETNTLLIYKNTSLEWSSKLDFLPIAVNRAFLKHIKGALVLLQEQGRLDCCYLGTEPSIFIAPPLSSQVIDFQKAEADLVELERKLQNQNLDMPDNFEKEFRIHFTVKPTMLKYEDSNFNAKNAVTDNVCLVIMEVTPQVTFQEVQIAIFVNRPLDVEPKQVYYSNFKDKTTIKFFVFLSKLLNVPTLRLTVNVTVITNLGVPRYLTKEIFLPLNLVTDSCLAEKESRHKITLSLDQKTVELESLFSEYNGEKLTANTIGFKNSAGDVVSIFLAKNSDRYGLQSNSFFSLSLITEQLILRLKKHYSVNEDFKITLSSSLPTSEAFKFARLHFEVKHKVRQLEDDLSQLSAQYRLIQKRLITKLKSKEPTPLKNLELLLNDTHRNIVEVTEKLQFELENLNVSQVNLTCALFLVNQLIKLFNEDEEVLNLANSIFGVEVTDVEGQSWEDVTETNLCYLLRTTLAKSDRDKQMVSETAFDNIKDLSKLEKHFIKVLERLSRFTKREQITPFEGSKDLLKVPEDEELMPGSSTKSTFNIDNVDTESDGTKNETKESNFAETNNLRGLPERQSLLTKRKK